MKIVLVNDLTEQQAREWLSANADTASQPDAEATLEQVIERVTATIKDDFNEDIDEQVITIGFQVALRPMKRYKVTATMSTDLYTFVTAYDEDHALRLGREIANDGGMTEEEGMCSGYFTMCDAYEQADVEGEQ